MASIIREPDGRIVIQFISPDGRKRPKIRFGEEKPKKAEEYRGHVEELVQARKLGRSPHKSTLAWIEELSEPMRKRLVKVGLLDASDIGEEPEAATLEAFVQSYIRSRKDLKAGTRINYTQTKRNLLEFLGADKPLQDISAGDADEWRIHLVDQGLSPSTVARRVKHAKTVFGAAVRKRLIESNPFAELKGGSMSNAEKFRFVTRAEAAKVLDACPDDQWRLIVALARFGGLRCPSEVLALTWNDINWEQGSIRVPSPKTEHIEGRASRTIPLFPELLPYLQAVFDEAEPGTVHVITRYRETNKNLRTQFGRIVKRAGLDAWPKPFQNLRSTRETELAEDFPEHVICQWIGNSIPVARRHYLQVTDEHFKRAVQKTVQNGAELTGNGRSKQRETRVIPQETAHSREMMTPTGQRKRTTAPRIDRSPSQIFRGLGLL